MANEVSEWVAEAQTCGILVRRYRIRMERMDNGTRGEERRHVNRGHEGRAVERERKRRLWQQRAGGETSFIVKSRRHRGLSLSPRRHPLRPAFLRDTPYRRDVDAPHTLRSMVLLSVNVTWRTVHPGYVHHLVHLPFVSSMSVNCR